MTEFIYGVPSSGKTTLLYNKIKDKLASGGEAVLIVPDQEALGAEAALARLCRGIPTVNLRVYGFSRLADDVFRRYGGVCYDTVDRTGQTLAMFLAVCAVSPSLRVYGRISPSDASLLSSLIGTVAELRRQGVTADQLSSAAETVDVPALSEKLGDIALLMPAYRRIVNGGGDDPDDVLDRLYEKLFEHGGMPGVDVYIDSFVSFTGIQLKIIELLMSTCNSVTVTFGVPGPGGAGDCIGLLSSIYDSERKLRAAAARHGGAVKTVLGESHAAPHMKALERALRTGGGEPCECGDGVRFFRAASQRREAELVAADIKRRMREGCRCRDIAILCRSAESWRGIIDEALEKYGVPYFISVRDDARQKALSRLILSAFSVCVRGFRTQDVCVYVKTGLLRVSSDRLDEFEDYISRRGIRGASAFCSEFTGSPDNYGAPSGEAAIEKLARINETREQVIEPLYEFYTALRGCVTAKDISTALVGLLSQIGITETLEALRHRALSENDPDEAEQTQQLWDVFCRATAQLCRFCGDAPVNAGQYARLLDTVLAQTDIGKIPTSTDQVTVGESGMLRVSDIKHVYLIGCEEGEFPAAVTDPGLFDDSDRQALSDVGIELDGGTDRKNERELYDFYRCACSASETVTFCYSTAAPDGKEKHPCHPLSDVGRIFPGAKTVGTLSVEDIAGSARASFEYAAAHKDEPDGRLLNDIVSSSPGIGSPVYPSVPLVAKREELSPDTMESLIPGAVRLSPTRLASFSGCPFSHCCNYFLRLDDGADIGFDMLEFGNFIHFILQNLIEDCMKDEAVLGLTGDALREQIGKYVNAYCRAVLKTDPAAPGMGRFRAALRRLEKCAVSSSEDILKELRTGKFKPAATEVAINAASGVAPLLLDLRNGKKTYLTGKIDRVDTYERDGVTYIKLVDYKSGNVKFDISKLAEADRSVQLFMYMLTVCTPGGKFEHPVPAALFYMQVVPPVKTVKGSDDIEDDGPLPRGGIALSEDGIPDALEPGMGKKGGNVYRTNAGNMVFAASDEMTAVFEQVKHAVTDAAERMCGGDASLTDKSAGEAPCTHCPYIFVCRYTKKKERKRS